jgi:hypothetical protein
MRKSAHEWATRDLVVSGPPARLPYATQFRIDSVFQSAFISFREFVPRCWRYLGPVFSVGIPGIQCPMQVVCAFLFTGFPIRRSLFFRVIAHLSLECAYVIICNPSEPVPLKWIRQFFVCSIARVINGLGSDQAFAKTHTGLLQQLIQYFGQPQPTLLKPLRHNRPMILRVAAR